MSAYLGGEEGYISTSSLPLTDHNIDILTGIGSNWLQGGQLDKTCKNETSMKMLSQAMKMTARSRRPLVPERVLPSIYSTASQALMTAFRAPKEVSAFGEMKVVKKPKVSRSRVGNQVLHPRQAGSSSPKCVTLHFPRH